MTGFGNYQWTINSNSQTLKPDVGASPADLEYGEGLAVPGDLLPNYPGAETNNSEQQ